MLHLLLFRRGLSILAGNRLSKQLAQSIELPVRLLELLSAEPDALDEHADMRHGSLGDAWSDGQGCLLSLNSVANGAVFALWPVMWIVVNALLLYNVAVRSGRFDAFRNWIASYLPNDRRVVLVVVGFCFGALLEGVSGFGTPVAITSSLLILVGFPPLEALVFVLIFNTAPVAFGALGVPVTVPGAVTGPSLRRRLAQ